MSTDTRKWFKEAGYGMMIHWGLYSLLAGEWKDQKCGNYAEWIQTRCRIPISEYDKLATAFNPVYFNMIYNKNSPTSSGSEMNCRFEHKCS